MFCSCCLCVLYVALIFGVWFGIRFYLRKQKLDASVLQQKSVLITGADTGFGRMTTERLDSKQIRVFAGCLTQQAVTEIKEKCSSRVVPFLMDVTSEESVQKSYEIVQNELKGEGLWAVINNAGLLRSGPLDVAPISDWRLQLDVNVIGIAITTKTFLPLLRKGKGRIVNISSVAGRFATAGTSAYNASKFAVQGLSDSWRRELSSWGITVIICEPGIMKTPLWDVPINVSVDQIWEGLTPEQQEFYGKDYFVQGLKQGKEIVEKVGGDPVQVVDVLEETVSAKYPQHRYAVGMDSPLWIGLALIPSFVSDVFVKLLLSGPKPKGL